MAPKAAAKQAVQPKSSPAKKAATTPPLAPPKGSGSVPQGSQRGQPTGSNRVAAGGKKVVKKKKKTGAGASEATPGEVSTVAEEE